MAPHGSWQIDGDATQGNVRFSLFFPGADAAPAQFETAGKGATYGDPQIKSIQVVGDFMHHLGLHDWDIGSAPQLTASQSGNGHVWSYETTTPIPAGFHEYKYFVTFNNGHSRYVGDPYARYGGKEQENSAFVVGGSSPEANAVSPVFGRRKPLRDLVVYELMLDDFTDEYRGHRAPLDAAMDKLDYLVRLGINAILLMPWTAWPGTGYSWGYTPYQYFSVEYRYANALNAPAEKLSWLKKLISACHDRGIHVIMDGVFNHVGDTGLTGNAAYGFPYRWLYQNEYDCPYIGQFGDRFESLLELDYNNRCTQEFIRDVCFYWIDTCGLDGIRFDCTKGFYVPGSSKGLPELIASITSHVGDPNFSTIIEHIDISACQVANTVGATSYWNNALYDCAFDGLWQGKPASRLMTVLDSHGGLAPDRVATTYLSNHDHSHIAWRAGARDNCGARNWFRVQPYAIALFTMPGCPLFFNGTEFAEDYWLMEDDQGTGRRVQARPLRWSHINDTYGQGTFALFAKLIAIRKSHPGLRSDNIYPAGWQTWQERFDPNGYGIDTARGLVIFHRWGSDGTKLQRVMVAINFSCENQEVDIPFAAGGTWHDTLNGDTVQVSGGFLRGVTVNSHWGRVYVQRDAAV